MPLLSLPDDCLGEVCSFLSVRDLSLSWRATCKVLASVVRDAAVREAMVQAGSQVTTLGLAAAAERTAFGDLEALQRSWEGRASNSRDLGEYKFLVALDVGRAWERAVGPRCTPLKAPSQAPPRLQFRACAATFGDHCSLVLDGDLPTIWSDDFEEEHGGLHVAVVEKFTGQVRRLIAGPYQWDVVESVCYYDTEGLPDNTLSNNDSSLRVKLQVHHADNGAEKVSIHCSIHNDYNNWPAGKSAFVHGIASLFM
ncbi:hypothetical protein TeGR_g11174 [Tetraparma gracilis]|uniref:F-box domain-containing protein n=1 Tax=Tetraparma gracilis TaxID=2962635 RepID=A0ABQ6N831_9STRA|nr:hypothetical protein TeGR_g11174 [Tetraparma gracilis]